MKRIGLRRVAPWLSYALRWYLVTLMLGQRAFDRATPEEKCNMMLARIDLERRFGLWP